MSTRRAPVDPASAAARRAGLRYVSDAHPGIRRRTGPLGFVYVRPNGQTIRRASELTRVLAIGVPPAWTDVWISTEPRGHIQATGRDARGRKQYRYHADWRACRDDTKFGRLGAFGSALPALRARTSADMARPGLPRDKVLATVVQLLDKSLIRIGNEEYAQVNGSFGLTTLRDRHVDVRGGALRFEFRGKSGVKHTVSVNDARVARVVRQCRDLPGQELFQYVDDDGERHAIGSADVNAYLKAATGQDFTAKEFRTWAGTVLACTALQELENAESEAAAKRNVNGAIEAVAKLLGNTRAVCRKSYIHPAVIDAYIGGAFVAASQRRTPAHRKNGLRAEEVMTLRLLQKRAARAA